MTNKELAPFSIMRLLVFSALIVGVSAVIRPFLIAIVWAVVISVTTWPLNLYLRRKIAYRSEALAALCMTTLLVTLILGVVIPFSFELTAEVKRLLLAVRESVESGGIRLPKEIGYLPWLDAYLRPLLAESGKAKEEAFRILEDYQPQMLLTVSLAARGIWSILFNLGVTIFSSYFFFRYGDILGKQLTAVSRLMGGVRYVDLVNIAWTTVQGVVYGVVGTAIIQGILAGVGYYVCGAPLPLLFGVLTIILGLVPFGPPLLYLPVAGFLFLSGDSWYYGVGLAVWGVTVVSTVDNFFRPIFISHTTNLSILLAFFGGLGGIAAFGMVGLFVGPVLLALAQTAWLGLVRTSYEIQKA
jgi:predicted PurR-regulated permease PerM